MSARTALSFAPRETPLPACAVAAVGEVAARLVARLLDADDDSLAALEGVAGGGVVVLLGEERRLPWVDGVVYLGADPANAALLLPTTLVPNVPTAWVASIVEGAGAKLPFAVVPREDGLEVLPLGAARPLARARLEAFVAEAR